MAPINIPFEIRYGESTTVLGIPIGSLEACRKPCQAHLNVLQSLWNERISLQDPNVAFHILRLCAGYCELMYLSRTTPPHITNPIADQFDKGMRGTFEKMPGKLTNLSWHQAPLPFLNEGLGLSPLTDINLLAYTASILESRDLISPLTGNAPRIASIVARSFDRLHCSMNSRSEASLEYLIHKRHYQLFKVQDRLSGFYQSYHHTQLLSRIQAYEDNSVQARLSSACTT